MRKSVCIMCCICAAILFSVPVFGDEPRTSSAPVASSNDFNSEYFIKKNGALAAPYNPSDELLTDITGVFGDQFVCMAVDKNANLWAWGGNWWGLLAKKEIDEKESSEYSNGPLIIMDHVQMVSIDASYALALKDDSSVWTWGVSNNGGTEYPLEEKRTNYEPVRIMENADYIQAFGDVSLVVKKDGSLYVWGGGLNIKGAADAIYWDAPYKVAEHVRSVELTRDRLYMILTDNSLWKMDRDGESGPEQVMENVRCVSEWAIVQTDGSLWIWEYDDVTEERVTPVKVMENVTYVHNNIDNRNTYFVTDSGELWVAANDREKFLPEKLAEGVIGVSGAQEATEQVTPFFEDGEKEALGNKEWNFHRSMWILFVGCVLIALAAGGVRYLKRRG